MHKPPIIHNIWAFNHKSDLTTPITTQKKAKKTHKPILKTQKPTKPKHRSDDLGHGGDKRAWVAMQGWPWSLLVVSIRACWWWEREIEGSCLAGLWREKMRERKSLRGRVCERYRVKRERANITFYWNFKCKKFCTNLPKLVWLTKNIYHWLYILLQNKHYKMWKYFPKNSYIKTNRE